MVAFLMGVEEDLDWSSFGEGIGRYFRALPVAPARTLVQARAPMPWSQAHGAEAAYVGRSF